MEADKVIDVLEDMTWSGEPCEGKTPLGCSQYIAIKKAISMIKENGELRKENEAMSDSCDAEVIYKLQQELTDLKKAVANEGLGVEEMAMIMTQVSEEKYYGKALTYNYMIDEMAKAIVEAQTKYKKGEI